MRYAMTCLLLVGLSCAVFSGDSSAGEPNAEGSRVADVSSVSVETSPDLTFARSVIIDSTDGDWSVTWENQGKRATFAPFSESSVSMMHPGICELRRVRLAEGHPLGSGLKSAPAVGRFKLMILAATEAKFIVRVRDRQFRLDAQSVLGEPDSEPAPPPIDWSMMVGPSTRKLSNAVVESSLASTGRVLTATGQGTCTLCRMPPEFAGLLGPNEVLAITAAHVVPEHLRGTKITVELFTFDKRSVSTTSEYPARLLFSHNMKEYDVAGIVVQLSAETRATLAPIAPPARWIADGVEYLQIGCPNGADPTSASCKALCGTYDARVGEFMVDRGSSKGSSGGGLFDPEGYLIGVLSGSNGPSERSQMLQGAGLLQLDGPNQKPKMGRLVSSASSAFSHTGGIWVALAQTQSAFDEQLRWVELKLPVLAEGRTSPSAEEGLDRIQDSLTRAVSGLPVESRAGVQAAMDEALAKYRRALLSK